MKTKTIQYDNENLLLISEKKHLHGLTSAPKKIIKENSVQDIVFNIMPGRDVSESILINEYRIWDNAIESVFSRDYKTDMLRSPDHLTFLSSLINLQKMVYVFMHEYLSIKYDPRKEEPIKVWPGNLSINMPKMILRKENIHHLMIIKSINRIKHNRYKVRAVTVVDGIVEISGDALIAVL